MTNAKLKRSVRSYTTEFKLRFIADYIVIGNVTKTCHQLDFPYKTGNQWLLSEWGQTQLARLQIEKSHEIDAAMTKIIENAANHVINSLEFGDEKLDKNNEIIRLRMPGKSAATVMGIAFDKRQISRNLPTSINSNVGNEALLKLQQQFQALSKNTKIVEGVVIEQNGQDLTNKRPK